MAILAVPVSGTQTINEAWQDTATAANQNRYPGFGTMLTGSVAGAVSVGFDAYTPAGPSIKLYNSATGGYTGIANTKNLQISNPKGYMVLVRGDRSVTTSNQAPTATTMRTKGKLFTPADAPAVINVASGTFESIGNPYASAIDFSQVTKADGVQTDFFYVWDPKLTTTTGAGSNSSYGLGGFQTFVWNGTSFEVTPGGGSYSGTNRNIESGQAFFVRAPFSAGTVSFTEACKVNGSNNVNRITSNLIQLRSRLHVISAGNKVLIDGNLVQFDPSYSNSIDDFDGMKINNTGENLGLLRNENKLAVERRTLSDTIFYYIGQLRLQQYEFEFDPSGLGQTGLTAFLEDNYLHSSTPIDLNNPTHVQFNVINDAGSYATDRFRIVFKQIAPLPVSFTQVSATRNSDKTIAVKWKVESETSMQLYTVERSVDGRNFSGMITNAPIANNGGNASYSVNDFSASTTDNFYRIKALSLSGQIQYSQIVKLAPLNILPSVEVYPNPVAGRSLHINFNGIRSGAYSLQLISINGQQQKLSTIQIASGDVTSTVKIPSFISAGIYQLIITGTGDIQIIKTVHIID